jgi:hypothetical protein
MSPDPMYEHFNPLKASFSVTTTPSNSQTKLRAPQHLHLSAEALSSRLFPQFVTASLSSGWLNRLLTVPPLPPAGTGSRPSQRCSLRERLVLTLQSSFYSLPHSRGLLPCQSSTSLLFVAPSQLSVLSPRLSTTISRWFTPWPTAVQNMSHLLQGTQYLVQKRQSLYQIP